MQRPPNESPPAAAAPNSVSLSLYQVTSEGDSWFVEAESLPAAVTVWQREIATDCEWRQVAPPDGCIQVDSSPVIRQTDPWAQLRELVEDSRVSRFVNPGDARPGVVVVFAETDDQVIHGDSLEAVVEDVLKVVHAMGEVDS